MIILKILLLLAGAFALYWQIKIKKVFPAFITVGMIAGMMMVFILPGTIRSAGFLIYIGFVALAFIYGLTVQETGIGSRMVIILMSAGMFTFWLWVLNHWHGNELLAPMLTLIAGSAGIIGKVKLRNELGFLILLATDAFAILVEYFLKSN